MKKIILIVSMLLFTGCNASPNIEESRGLNVKTLSKEKKIEQRVALVIGNNDYVGRLSKLSNPINDAQVIRDILKERGFQVIYVEDSNKKSMKQSLDRFYRKIQQGGVGMFYFSGHGIEVEGQNYLIPIDAKIEAKSDTEYEAVALSKITKQMQNAGNRLNIVVLDACRNDPFSRGVGTGGLAKIEPIGMFVSYSTGAGSVASDGEAGGNGLFTKSLIKYMKRGLDLQGVFQETRKEVYQASNHKQFPAIYDQTINGKFYFTSPSSTTVSESKIAVEPTAITLIAKENRKIYGSKVIINPLLASKINIDNHTRNRNNLIEVIINIDNKSNERLTLQYRVKWLNNDGFEVGETLSSWEPLFLDARDNKKLKEIAPMPTASSYKLYFR
jgi:uncharacterized protein YcfL